MLQDKLPELVKSAFNIRVLVSASFKAKETLAAKGLTPSIFLQRFYRQKGRGSLEVVFSIGKDRQSKPFPDIVPVDYDDYDLVRKEEKEENDDLDQERVQKKIFEQLRHQHVKYQKQLKPQMLNNRAKVQNFMNNQSFHWFEKANKLFYHSLSLIQSNSRVSTTDQPMGLVFIIEVEKQKSCKEVFDKIKKQSDSLLKKLYEVNPNYLKAISNKIMIIIMFDVSQGAKIQQALNYTTTLKNQYGINSSLIYRLQVNGDDLHDSIDWSQYHQPIIHFKYELKPSDPIRFITEEQIGKVQDIVDYHKKEIKKSLEQRLDQLFRKYEQINARINKFINLFKGNTPTQKYYVAQENQFRELADKLFLLEDYKKAYDIYRNVASKLENRNYMIENNLAEMIQLCLGMSKFHNIRLRSDPFKQIQKYSQKILQVYNAKSKLRHKKYMIFLLYIVHAFKVYDRNWMKEIYYFNIKQGFTNYLSITALLLYEQYAHLNLFYKNIDYRKYCYDLTRVASRFTDSKLYSYSLRCLLIVQSLYGDTFPNIQKYHCIQLSHLYLEMKNYKQSLKNLKKSWQICLNKIQSEQNQKQDGDLIKFIENFQKIMRQIEKVYPEMMDEIILPNIQIPVIQSVNVQTVDEMLDGDEKSGDKWSDIGQNYLEHKDLKSKGLVQGYFRNVFRSYDTGNNEQKQLIFKFKSNVVNEAILKKNSRMAYCGQPIIVSFYFRNPLKVQIAINNIALIIKQEYKNFDIKVHNGNQVIKPYLSSKVVFTIIPKEQGYLQLSRIQWIFMKMIVNKQFKEPAYTDSQYKSCFFKLNVHKEVGRLQTQAHYEQSYYQGQRAQVKLRLKNIGQSTITTIYLNGGCQQLFGFVVQELNKPLKPNEEQTVVLKLKIPFIGDKIKSGEQKRIVKMILLYETQGKFRTTRIINKINILRVIKLQNILCQRLSTHLHLLSYTSKHIQAKHQPALLQYLIIPYGFQIVKMEVAQLAKETKYFFFIRKGNFKMQKYYFHPQAKIQYYPSHIMEEIAQMKSQQKIGIVFLWKKAQKFGTIKPSQIPIIINSQSCISNVFPLDIKVHFSKEVNHNFNAQPYLQVPVELKLKNIYMKQALKITIYFSESRESDSCWQGMVQKKVKLEHQEQIRIKVNYIVMHAGIYEISNELKYTIENHKGQQKNINHSEYEQIYLRVVQENNHQNYELEDAFKEFQVPKEEESPKQQVQEQQQSLI